MTCNHPFDPKCHLCRHFALHAAAPELLRTLQDLVNAVDENADDVMACVRNARIAINAATGATL